MIKLVQNEEEATAITHSGSFHADDIFSTIFLSKFQDIYLYRTNEVTEEMRNSNKIIFDIGNQEFDHHGPNAKIRENGIKYSAFGLLFEKYGKDYLKQKNVSDIEIAYQMFLNEFVMQIDAFDNGVFPPSTSNYSVTSLSSVIELFNKTWKEEKNTDEAFLEGLEVGELIFNRIEKRILDKLSAKEKVEIKIEESQNHLLILDEYLPFMDLVLTSENKKQADILFAIFPSNRGGYNIQAIHENSKTFKNRLDFPKEWGGKSKEELNDLTKIATFRFCHINLFLCSCDTLEDAIKVASLAMKK